MTSRLANINPMLYNPEPLDMHRIQADLDPSLEDPLDAEEGKNIILPILHFPNIQHSLLQFIHS